MVGINGSEATRRRAVPSIVQEELDRLDKFYSDLDEDIQKKSRKHSLAGELGYTQWLAIFVFIAALYAAVVWKDLQMPPVVSKDVANAFSEERAKAFLERLAGLGPRPSGSDACEVEAFKMITGKIDKIQYLAENIGVNRLEMDVQRPSGCYDLPFLSAFTLCYHSITNIVARIGPTYGPTDHAILLNCHFDTLPDTPGATDDAVSCAIMLEVLEVLANSTAPLENDVVFLFNGAEENFLQGSHGFITSHPWRHALRAFINLEGTGSGGREILFQSGPGDAWLLKTYIDNAPHPHCSVIAQEIFQSGIIPSDTDFRIFRDYGRLSGLDIAYHRNGWLYHTEFDRTSTIHNGSLQRAGENVLAVVRALIRSPYMQQPANFNEGNKWIFFDVIGMFPVHYEISTGTMLNILAICVVFAGIVYQIKMRHYQCEEFFSALTHHAGALFVMTAAGILIAVELSWFGQTMLWYSTPELVFPIYVLPMIIAGLAFHAYCAERVPVQRRPVADMTHYDSALALWAVLLIVMTYYKLASAFFVFIHLAFPIWREPILRFLGKKFHLFTTVTPNIVLSVQCACMVPIMIFVSYAVMFIFDFFVPVMGRLGNLVNPEFLIMPISLVAAYTFVLYTNNLIYISRRMNYFIRALTMLWILAMAIILTTRVGYPYQFSETSPRLRRIIALDTKRTFQNAVNGKNTSDHGMYLVSFDYRSTADLPEHSFTDIRSEWTDDDDVNKPVELLAAGKVNCSDNQDEYCRLPYYTAVHRLIPPEETRYIPTAFPPKIPFPVSLAVADIHNRDEANRVKLAVKVVGGTGKISLHITPLNGYRLVYWTFGDLDELHKQIGHRRTYFVFLTYGSEAPKGGHQFEIYLERPILDASEAETKPLLPAVEITAAAFYTHGKYQNSATISQFRQIIAERRQTPHAAVGYWRWAMTMIGGVADVFTIQH